MAATVIQMPKRESALEKRPSLLDLLLGIATWGFSLLISIITFYLIGHCAAVIVRHFHHS
jgi:hypothetical protein